MATGSQGRFTGWHMLAVMVGFFGVVIAVNFTMARIAIGSFGGVVVENSYVASQNFNTWLAAARAQDALGWQVTQERTADGHLAVRLLGVPGPVSVSGHARHPLGRRPDMQLSFVRKAEGFYTSSAALDEGRWIVRLQVTGDGKVWRSEKEL